VSLFPLATFERIDNAVADRRMLAWEHYLEECDRPFGVQSFGLFVAGELISVAVSASTVSKTCAGRDRQTLVELARLCTHPDQRWATRVCLRLWREIAHRDWSKRYWPVDALVSYQSAIRHTGNVYRFDGWTKVADTLGSAGGGTWSEPKAREPKALWLYELRKAA
jgi:hypothetical protein